MSDFKVTTGWWLSLVLGVLLFSLPAHSVQETEEQAQLDQLLAPIALYPDTILSHVLIASTYPLEVVQAARWAERHQELDPETALERVEQQPWDPSVKALVAFPDLLQRMSDDLEWLEQLGEIFLTDEAWVMLSIQQLRQRAYAHGALDDVEHIVVQREVEQQQEVIIIEPRQREVIYVPYYNTRVVYGDWWWPHHPPYYWHYPGASYSYSAFYWGPSYRVSPRFYFSSFHWHHRHVIVNHHHFYHPPRYYPRRVVHIHHGQRWQHNPVHRRGVVYRRETLSRQYDPRPRSHTREVRGPASPSREWRRPRQQPSGDFTTSSRTHERRQATETRRQSSGHRDRVNTEHRNTGRTEQGASSLRATGSRELRDSNLQQRRQQLQQRQTESAQPAHQQQRQQQADRQATGSQTRSTETLRRDVQQQRQQASEYRGANRWQQPVQQTGSAQRQPSVPTEQRQSTVPQNQLRAQQNQPRVQATEQRRIRQPESVRQVAAQPPRVQRAVEPQVRSTQSSAPTQVRPQVRAQSSAPRVERAQPQSRPQSSERNRNRPTERRQRQIE
ncbi:DUF3300 domain-containing protein [Alkalimonas delamerensis]|uniref:DUF3300 domain-containing protein n=1 Tax=Alkalimonas delamerensis TaxID=265981 RepID=A0ABT9GSY0_9GAMM|nr:DUF3300 domain-containing protein [Alkalimonas delamerensis]MDP4529736.1 DUF3300 domain-containing protein [Alkalimonas delamerensis]